MLYNPFNQNKQHIDNTNYYFFEKAFHEKEIEAIENLSAEFQKGLSGGKVNLDYRDQDISWIELKEESKWIYDKITQMVNKANEIWEFDLLGYQDSIQYGQYAEGGHFDWHTDSGKGLSHRKISVCVQLNTDYKGGDLQILSSRDHRTVPKALGNVCIFPSYLLHRVTPIESGVRKSLVSWIAGPTLR